MSRKLKSQMWQYFERVNETQAQCKLCQKFLSWKTTVSNLKQHLKSSHVTICFSSSVSAPPTMTTTAVITSTARESVTFTTVASRATSSVVSSTVTASSGCQGNVTAPCTSDAALSAQTPGQHSHIRSYFRAKMDAAYKKKVDALVLRLFFIDFQPFSIVEDSAFCDLIKFLNSMYELPSRKTFSNCLLPVAYAEKVKEVSERMRDVHSICLTADLWTSVNNESYIAITGHMISDKFELDSVLLACDLIEGPHTSATLSKMIWEIVDRFHLTQKVSLVVTDNAPNITSAITNNLRWKHFPCYAHSLNLVVQNALKLFSEIHEKVKTIVSFFKRSVNATEKLLIYQRINCTGEPKKSLQDMPTRWNSTFLMLERFVQLQDAVKSTIALSNADIPLLTTGEWTVCSQMCQILGPFYEVTKELSGEKYATGSEIILITQGLVETCKDILKSPLADMARNVAANLLEGLRSRFQNLEMRKPIALSTILDPRFKMVPFQQHTQAAAQVKKYLTDLVSLKLGESRQSSSVVVESRPPPAATSKYRSIWKSFDEISQTIQSQGTRQSGAIIEVQRYLEMQIIPRTENPLKWWLNHAALFPTISQIVKERFNIVATSVPCERTFSKTGFILSDRRSRLKPSKVQQLVFLKANDHIHN